MWYEQQRHFTRHSGQIPAKYAPGRRHVAHWHDDRQRFKSYTHLAWNKARQYAALNGWAKRHLPECPDDGTTFQTYYLYNTTQCETSWPM